VELGCRGNIGGTLKKTAQNIAEKPRTNLAFIRLWVTMEVKWWSLGIG
jgi:hypothetical protein